MEYRYLTFIHIEDLLTASEWSVECLTIHNANTKINSVPLLVYVYLLLRYIVVCLMHQMILE